MVKIDFKDADGAEFRVFAAVGSSLMEAAVRGGVTAVEGECGGALACATCHIYIPSEWRAVTGDPSQCELDMLEFSIDVDERSRLSCQIALTPAMDGMTVLAPRTQR